MKGKILLAFLTLVLFSGCQENYLQLEKKEKFTYSAFHIAVRLSNFENVKNLINQKELNIVDPFGDTALIDATRNNNTKIATFLICYGADISIKDKNSFLPLDIATRNNNTNLVKLLTSKNLDSSCGYTFFKNELANISPKNATFDKNDLSFTFYQSVDLTNSFKTQLDKFIPILFKKLEKKENIIERIEIKSHTSSYAKNQHSSIGMFIRNKELSQERVRSIFNHISNMDISAKLKKKIVPFSMSSKDLILVNDKEDPLNSNRTEIKVILK